MNKKALKYKNILNLISNGSITQVDAAIRLDLSYRHTRRMYRRYLEGGESILTHKNCGRMPSNTYPTVVKEAILKLYQDKYWDFGPTLAAEKLSEDDHYRINAETLRLWLKAAGLWACRRKRKGYRSRRERRSRFGELLQLDGSIHAWLTGVDGKQCLMNMVDDATGKTLSFMDYGETTNAAFRLLRWWIILHGIPLAIYVDLKSLYVSPKSLKDQEDDVLVEAEWLTHFSRACKKLGIKIIKAYSPQAKGRVERSHAVYQDRFVKELRLKGVCTIEEANEVLANGFIDTLNKKFMKPPASLEDAHIAVSAEEDLDNIFCWEYTRIVQNDWTIRFENRYYQLQNSVGLSVRPKQEILVRKYLDGSISLWSTRGKISYSIVDQPVQAEKIKLGKDRLKTSKDANLNKFKSPWSKFNPGWLKQTQGCTTTDK